MIAADQHVLGVGVVGGYHCQLQWESRYYHEQYCSSVRVSLLTLCTDAVRRLLTSSTGWPRLLLSQLAAAHFASSLFFDFFDSNIQPLKFNEIIQFMNTWSHRFKKGCDLLWCRFVWRNMASNNFYLIIFWGRNIWIDWFHQLLLLVACWGW